VGIGNDGVAEEGDGKHVGSSLGVGLEVSLPPLARAAMPASHRTKLARWARSRRIASRSVLADCA